MSAYMVEDKTINLLIAAILHGSRDNPLPVHFLITFGLPDMAPDNCARLGQILFEMNIESIEQRYGKGEAKQFRPLDYQYRVELPPFPMQLYKTLGCFLYQCYEGDVSETPIFKALEGWKHDIAAYIVASLPQYEQAAWA